MVRAKVIDWERVWYCDSISAWYVVKSRDSAAVVGPNICLGSH